MEHSDIVGGLLAPTDQDATKPIHPTMSAFHDPTPGLGPRLVFDLLRLFSFGRNV